MNVSPATGKRRGSSGFVKPELYAKAKQHKADVCLRTTGYELAEYADNIEKMLVSGDYRLFYKHFYYADANKNLRFKTEGADEDYIIDKEDYE